jgi:WD40 repeat protein
MIKPIILILCIILNLASCVNWPPETETKPQNTSSSSNITPPLINAEPGKCVTHIATFGSYVPSTSTKLALSPDGKILASATGIDCDVKTCAIKLWDAHTGDPILSSQPYDLETQAIVFSADGKSILSGHALGIIQQWSATDGKLIMSTKRDFGSGPIYSLAINPEEDLTVVTGSESGKVTSHYLKKNTQQLMYDQHTNDTRSMRSAVNAVDVSTDGKNIIASFHRDKIMLIHAEDKTVIWSADTDRRSIRTVAFSPDDRMVMAADEDLIVIRDAANGNKLTTLETEPRSYASAFTAAFSPDGETMIGGDANGFITLWDIKTETMHSRFPAHEAFAGIGVQSLLVPPDGNTIISASHGTIKFWDLNCLLEHND